MTIHKREEISPLFLKGKRMKLFHLSDLHIGKVINGYDMYEDQEYVFNQILEYMKQEQPDALIIAGDIYDKVVPSAKAVRMFDAFLTAAADSGSQILIISGNHDSPERLDFGKDILKRQNIYMKGTYGDGALKVTLQDSYGNVNIYLLPFIKPADVVQGETVSYTDAMIRAIAQMGLAPEERNILVAHQNVTNGGENRRTESETIIIGGVDNIDSFVFRDFDYVALGHLHSPQSVGRKEIRYCGTPVIYSMSEASDKKSVTVVEMKEKGTIAVRELPLKQLHQWYDFTGTLEEAMRREENEDYARIILTDKETIIDAQARLRTVYRKLMTMEFQGLETNVFDEERTVEKIRNLQPEEAVADFYQKNTGKELSDENLKYIQALIQEYKEI